MCAYICPSMCVEIRGQLMGVGFLLLPCEFQGLNSDCQGWWQVPLLGKPYCQPNNYSSIKQFL